MTTSRPGPLGFARIAGASIAARGAAARITDSLNAAYRPAGSEAERAFWGDDPSLSMLRQLALRTVE